MNTPFEAWLILWAVNVRQIAEFWTGLAVDLELHSGIDNRRVVWRGNTAYPVRWWR